MTDMNRLKTIAKVPKTCRWPSWYPLEKFFKSLEEKFNWRKVAWNEHVDSEAWWQKSVAQRDQRLANWTKTAAISFGRLRAIIGFWLHFSTQTEWWGGSHRSSNPRKFYPDPKEARIRTKSATLCDEESWSEISSKVAKDGRARYKEYWKGGRTYHTKQGAI